MEYRLKTTVMALCFGVLAAGSAFSGTVGTPKERYNAAIELSKTDPSATVDALWPLAEEGYSRALDRLAYFHLKGFGVEKDVAVAIDLYSEAIAAGRVKSLLSLGKAQMSVGDGAAAEATFRLAILGSVDIRGSHFV